MSKNRYRLYGGIVIFIALYGFVLFGNKTGAISVLWELLQEVVINTSLPSSAFIADVDNTKEWSIMQAVLNDMYPMNDYLMSNENTGTTGEKAVSVMSDSAENSVSETENQSNSADTVNASSEANTDMAKENVPESTAAQENAAQAPKNQSAGLQVVSRNAVTGNVFSKEQLSDYSFLLSKFYTITSITELTKDILRPEEFLNKNLSINKDASKPQILIFHTHSQETFADSVEGDISTSIVGVGDYLTQLLQEKYGYKVIHDRSVYDYVDGKLDRSKAYTYAENGIAKILQENPSIEVVLDLHRDGVAETTHLVTEIDGKKMAKIMFFNGLSYSRVKGDIGYLHNPYRDDNLAMSLQMHLLGEAYYPGFLRNIYINAYRYCLHERGRSMLIEAGAQTNTVQEVKNAMEPLADMLDKLLRGEKVY